MKKILSLLSLAALTVGLLGSCSKINERIDDLDKRVYDLENGKIASVQQQIDGIKASITKLEAADVTVNGKIDELKATAETHQTLIDALKEADKALGQKDDALEARIATLEGQVTTINGQIDALVNADIAINTRIDELKTYVDTEIGKTKDWAEETFATLEQYQQTADDLAALSVTVTGISTTLAGMQTSISGLDTKIDGINADLQGKITAAKTELEGKITSLKTELEGKIASEISASETSIKSWINELLEGYYTIAQVDAKIGALNTAIETAKSTSKTRIDSVATELTALKKVVDTEKATIRAEYKNAIDVAINKLDGEIRGALKDSVVAVNGRIVALDTRVTSLEIRMQAVEGKVDKLEAALGAYTELQGTITEIIKKLLADVGDKPQSEQDTTIWKCITALQAQCGTFGTAIETLQGLVGNKDVATQISEAIASLITTQKLEGLADAVSALKDIVYGKGDVKSLTQQIADINTALSTTYVTKTQLSQDIAAAKSELQSQIDSLCNVIGADGDATTATGIFKKIAELNARVAALEAVKITIESTEYTNWSDAVQAVLNKVNALGIGNISGLQSALNDLEARLDKIEAMIQSVTILPAYTDGSVEAVNGILTIDFVVSPAAAVKGVTKDSIKVLVHQAKVQTKAATSYTIIDVESATVDEATGDVTITADISGIAPAEGNGLTVAVNIKNGGISNFTTEAVPVYVYVAPTPTTTGTAKATIGELQVDVRWIQLWENGPKFAEYNVGVTNGKAESYGGYYTWGGTYNNDSHLPGFSWNDDHNLLHTTDNDNLTSTEDTATKLWGENWRMPTKAELEALFNSTNCTVEWTTVGGVYGRKFTGKTEPYSSNSVFLPAAGCCYKNSEGDIEHDSGRDGYYWSSTSNGSNSAYFLYFFESSFQTVPNNPRYAGSSVRAVLKELPPSTGTATAKINGKDVNVNWVQLWENGPKFAEYNVGASSATETGTTMTFTDATAENFTWGPNWCTPSKDQMNELWLAAQVENKSSKVTCQYCEYTTSDGKWGFKFTGKETGYTGNSVFFPADRGDIQDGADYFWSATANGNEAWAMLLHGYGDEDGHDLQSEWYSYSQNVDDVRVRPVLKN